MSSSALLFLGMMEQVKGHVVAWGKHVPDTFVRVR